MAAIKYETGATSQAINDLILFTDKELTEKRDSRYEYVVAYEKLDHPFIASEKYKVRMLKQYSNGQFKYLLYDVIRAYNKKIGDTYYFDTLSQKQKNEYARLYFEKYTTWKKEHGYA